jgi:hypothetical protein
VASSKQIPQPYAATSQLYHALIRVEVLTSELARHIGQLQEWMAGNPMPRDIDYVAPPRPDQDEELRAAIQKRRDQALRPRKMRLKAAGQQTSKRKPPLVTFRSQQAPWFSQFDAYHRMERSLRQAILNANRSAVEAASEIDSLEAAPLYRDSTRIREDLQGLERTLPSPRQVGDIPPTEPALLLDIDQAKIPISLWINKIRALLVPEPPSHVRDPEVSAADVQQGGSATEAEAFPPERKDGGYYSVADLAGMAGVDPEALRKRLDRWRRKNPGGEFIQNTERRSREPGYLYSRDAVIPVIEALKTCIGTSGIASAKRPAKENPSA